MDYGIYIYIYINKVVCLFVCLLLLFQLVTIVRELKFTLNNQTYSFNNDGEFENGYDLIMWKNAKDERKPSVVGKFLISTKDVEVYEHNIQWSNNMVR